MTESRFRSPAAIATVQRCLAYLPGAPSGRRIATRGNIDNLLQVGQNTVPSAIM
jgi:hypothetical protein